MPQFLYFLGLNIFNFLYTIKEDLITITIAKKPLKLEAISLRLIYIEDQYLQLETFKDKVEYNNLQKYINPKGKETIKLTKPKEVIYNIELIRVNTKALKDYNLDNTISFKL